MLNYIPFILLISMIGWLFELLVWKKNKPDGFVLALTGVDLPLRPLYGIGGLILISINSYFVSASLFFKVIVAMFALSAIECVGGMCSYKYHGYQTWHYESELCYGYISGYVSIFWAFLSVIFFYFYDYMCLY